MKRFSREKSDELVRELVSITFDTTGVDTDLYRLHTRCATALRAVMWSDLSSKRAIEKYIRLQLPLTIHSSLINCVEIHQLLGWSVDDCHKFIKDSFEYCVPALDELGI